jgi:hypothetical protein
VAIANAIGTGVADDKAIYCFVPEMIRFYLGEEPILENVKTYLLADPEVLEHVLGAARRARRQADRRVGRQGRVIGPHAERARSSSGCAEVDRAHPERWIAQEVVQLSTVPTVGRRRHARAASRRPAPVRGLRRADRIVPGGLTRVALEEGSMIVNSSRGGGSKDTWVLEDGDDADRAGPPIADTQPPALPDLRYGGWTGQQQQQQQQQQASRQTPRLMLARIAHELYWLGRNLARAEFTAAHVEAVFQAELQGASDDPPASASARAACWRSSATPTKAARTRRSTS